MFSTCRSSTRIASNAIPSCSYLTQRAQRSVSSVVKHQVNPRGSDNGYSDFVNRLRDRQKISQTNDGSQKGSKNYRSPLTLTVRGLKPYEVVERVNVLLAENKLDHAITMVESLPLDAINVVVWNVLIAEAIKANRPKLAFELYYDMKRRHIPPNTRTFTTLFVGLSKIEDWTLYSNILDRVFKAYDQLLVHFEKLKLRNPHDPDILPWPINGFLTLLGKSGHYAKMWDVFFSMEGPLSPDEVTYSIIFRAIQERTSFDRAVRTSLELEAREPPSQLIDMEKWEAGLESESTIDTPPEKGKQKTESIDYKNAADARMLWEHLVRASKKQSYPVPINSFHLTPLLKILAFGKPTDHRLAFKIIEEYLQLDNPLPTIRGKKGMNPQTQAQADARGDPTPLTPPLFSSVLEVCVQSARAEAAIKYFQAMAEDQKLKQIIDSRHMAQILKMFSIRRAPRGQTTDAREAISVLEWMLRERSPNPLRNDGKLDPWIDHFIYALTAAWKSGDMSSALLVFEKMTGLSRELYMSEMDGEGESGGAKTNTSSRTIRYLNTRYRGCMWNVTCMALLVKTAHTTQKLENMRIAMRILRHTTASRYFFDTQGRDNQPIQEQHLAAQKELASRTASVLEVLLANSSTGSPTELNQWKELRRIVKAEIGRLSRLEMHREEDTLREQELKKTNFVKDGDVQLLVTLKGRRSAWANNL